MRKVLRTAAADEDLIAIWLFIARESPAAADRTLDAIEAGWQRLAQHPFSGVAREDVGPGLRHLLVGGRYLVLHRITDRAIEIVRVLDGRRRLDDVRGG